METPNFKQIARSKQLQSPILQSVLLIIAGVLLWWFVVSPKYTAIQNQRAELAKINGQKEVFEQEQIELNKLIDKLKNSDSQVKLLDEAVPLSSRPTQIAVMIESYARSSSLEVSNINISDIDKGIVAGNKELLAEPYKPQRSLSTVKVAVGITGSTEQFKNFLQLLEDSGRLIDIESLEVSKSESGTKYVVNLITYAYEPI